MVGLRNIEPGGGALGSGVQGVVGWVLVAGDWLAGDDGATGLVADGKVDVQPGAGKAGADRCYPPVGIHCRANHRWLKGDVTALACLEPLGCCACAWNVGK